MCGGLARGEGPAFCAVASKYHIYIYHIAKSSKIALKKGLKLIEDGSTKRLAVRSPDKGGLCTGVSRINTGRYQGALRVVKKAPDDEDKSTATTIIKAESSQRANELAKDFIENGGSNKRRRSRGADQDEENEVEDVRDNAEFAVAEHYANSPAVEEEEDE